jgi:hypothetical protein
VRGNGGVRGVLVWLVLLGVVAGPVGAVADGAGVHGADVYGTGTRGADVPSIAGAESISHQTSPPEPPGPNNSSVQHANPEEASGDGNLDAVRRWLAGRMTRTLVDCTQRVTVVDRVACSRLDESYPDWLSKFVDVADDSPSEDDDSVARTFEETGERQREFVTAVNEYRETLDRYRRARETGNVTRARALARELADDAARVNESSTDLRAQYARLANRTGANVTDAAETVATTAERATETAAEIRARELVETVLRVNANRTAVAFDRPLGLTGTLLTGDGDPIENRTVAVVVGTQRHRVRTDGRGEFALTYRPTLLSLSNDSLRVAYRPRPASLFGESAATVPVRLSQTNATVTATAAPSTVAFGESVRVSGRVRAAGLAVPNVPVSVSLGGFERVTLRTDASGEFATNASVPAALPTGSATVRATLAVRERALNRSTDRATVRVRPSNTTLSLSVDAVRGTDVTLAGRLRTRSGTAVGGEAIRLRVEGTTVGTARTGPDGRFRAAVNLSAFDAAGDGTVTVAARYEPAGGNLEPARTALELELPNATGATGRIAGGSDGGARPTAPFGLDPATVVGLVVGAVVLALAGVVVGEATGLLPTRLLEALAPVGADAAGEVSASEAAAGGADGDRSGSSGGASVESALSARMKAQFEGGRTDAAVVAAYELLRRRVLDAFGASPSLTHWELLAHVEREGVADGDELGEVIAAYETAAFAPESVSQARAAEAVAAVEAFVSRTDQF